MLRLAIEHINSMRPRPRFVVICGDMINAMPSNENQILRKRQTSDLLDTLKNLNTEIRLVYVPGNHDIGNRPTSYTITNYKKEWGPDFFHFWISGVLFLVLNTQLYVDNSGAPHEAEQQDKWLHTQLTKQAIIAVHTVIFCHIPPFINQVDEDNNYSNLPKLVRRKLLKQTKDAGVSKWMCGHTHKNKISWFGNMEIISSSAVGSVFDKNNKFIANISNSGLRVVHVTNKKISHNFYTLDTFPVEY